MNISLKNSLIVVLFVLWGNTVFSQWKQESFLIGTYADPRISRDNDAVKDSISFSLAKNAYFNFLSGPQYYNGGRDFSMMDRTLDLAAKFGLKVLVIDHRTRVAMDDFTVKEADTIINHFKNVNPSRRNAMLGYYFGGEFPVEYAPNIAKWTGYFKQKDPKKLAYSYLLPRIAFPSNAKYEDYLDAYVMDKDKSKRPDVVAYDAYPFYKNGTTMNSYFYNLNIIRKKAGNRPFWYYVLSAGHGNYAEPTEYQLAFSVFAPLAYGAKGVLYFTYETIPQHYGGNYQQGLITQFGHPTTNYYIVKKINRFLQDIIGPVIMKSNTIGTYHLSGAPFNEQIPSALMLNKKSAVISAISNQNALAGVYVDKLNPAQKYVLVVNKTDKKMENEKIYFNINVDSALISPSYQDYNGGNKSSLLPILTDENKQYALFSLAPGEGKLISLKSKSMFF